MTIKWSAILYLGRTCSVGQPLTQWHRWEGRAGCQLEWHVQASVLTLHFLHCLKLPAQFAFPLHTVFLNAGTFRSGMCGQLGAEVPVVSGLKSLHLSRAPKYFCSCCLCISLPLLLFSRDLPPFPLCPVLCAVFALMPFSLFLLPALIGWGFLMIPYLPPPHPPTLTSPYEPAFLLGSIFLYPECPL